MSDTKEFYILGRSCHASARLSLQHWLLKDQLGLLHPSITTSWTNANSDTPRRVADVACGNAIWGIEVAESGLSKDLQVVGFDISNAQFPPREILPSNLSLSSWNMFEPPPKEYEGFFDVVNIRLILLALKDGNPRPVLENVLKLLKPGGFLQWIEIDMSSPAVPAESVYQRIGEIVTRAGGPRTFEWIKNLGKILESAGLQSVEYSEQLPRKSMQKFWIDQYVMAMGEIIAIMKAPDVEEWWTTCEQERTQKGVLALWPNIMCVGRKST